MKHTRFTPMTAGVTNETQLLSQALNTLREIPNLTVKKIVTEPKHFDHRIDLTIELRFHQKKFKVAIEAKASGEPAILRRSAAWLKEVLDHTKYDYGLIVAPYVSAEER